jgi:hypothetical protein
VFKKNRIGICEVGELATSTVHCLAFLKKTWKFGFQMSIKFLDHQNNCQVFTQDTIESGQGKFTRYGDCFRG